MYLAFDVETTGLPRHRKIGYKNTEALDNCRLVSLAIVQFNDKYEEVAHYSTLVKPEGFEVTATEIHGITHERAVAEGRPFNEVYEDVCMMFAEVPTVVGHNIEFDINTLCAEIHRRGLDMSPLENILPTCTLKMTKEIFAQPKKLGVLYRELFCKELDGAHDALSDARAAGEVYAVYKTRDPRFYRDIKVKTVYLKVSDVGAMLGMSQFKKPFEVIENLWSKYCPETFVGLTREQEAVETIEVSPSAVRQLYSNVAEFRGTPEEVQETFEKAREAIKENADLTPVQKNIVTDHLRKTLYTNHGITNEEVTADMFENVYEDHTFYKMCIARIEGTDYVLCGRVDRVMQLPTGKRVLIEIKNRTRGLFNKVRDYENAQVQTYLQMNRMWSYAKLVEQYGKAFSTHIVERDDVLWAKMMEGLTDFCKAAHHTMSSA